MDKSNQSRFFVRYIDGHDLKYKIFDTVATDQKEAISNLWNSYAHLGDFDHQIIDVIEFKKKEKERAV